MDQNISNDESQTNPSESEETKPELPSKCSICHREPPVNATQIDCGHIFCFSCIKSVLETTGACALCRAEISFEFNFREHSIIGAIRVPSKSDDGCYWFYEGFRGWWLYDADINAKIEEAYQSYKSNGGPAVVREFISGYTYFIDLQNLTQQREDGSGRSRKICRSNLDLDNILGLAGVKGQDFNDILEMMKNAANIMNP